MSFRNKLYPNKKLFVGSEWSPSTVTLYRIDRVNSVESEKVG